MKPEFDERLLYGLQYDVISFALVKAEVWFILVHLFVDIELPEYLRGVKQMLIVENSVMVTNISHLPLAVG